MTRASGTLLSLVFSQVAYACKSRALVKEWTAKRGRVAEACEPGKEDGRSAILSGDGGEHVLIAATIASEKAALHASLMAKSFEKFVILVVPTSGAMLSWLITLGLPAVDAGG